MEGGLSRALCPLSETGSWGGCAHASPTQEPPLQAPHGGGGRCLPGHFPRGLGGGAGSLSPPASCRAHEEGKGTEWLSQYKQPGFALPPTQAGCWPSGPAGHMG